MILAACGGGKSTDRSPVDSTLVYDSLSPSAPVDSTLRLIITNEPRVFADGRVITLTNLDSLLTALKLVDGEVWLYREPRDRPVNDQQDALVDSVLTAISRHELPLRQARRADFSDQAGKRRHPSQSVGP